MNGSSPFAASTRWVATAVPICETGNSINLIVFESPPCLSIHEETEICCKSLRALMAMVLPLRSAAVRIGESFATMITFVIDVGVANAPGAINLNGKPRS